MTKLLVNRNVNSSGGTTYPSSPNVGQYGWTKEDIGRYNQLIQYVDECRRILEEVAKVAASVAGIDAQVKEVNRIYTEVKRIGDEALQYYNQFIAGLTEFEKKYNLFNTSYADFIVKYNDVLDKHTQVLASAAAAASSAAAAKVSENETASDRAHVQALYDDLKKGQVYRGTWDPTTNVYPDGEGTNSMWDVILPSGQDSHTFDGKVWRSGDRLVYVESTHKYQQIESGLSGVKSINGKTGAVTIDYTDVGAEASGVANTLVSTHASSNNVHNISAIRGLQSELDTKVANTRRVNNKPLSSDITLSAADVGAIATVDGTFTGQLSGPRFWGSFVTAQWGGSPNTITPSDKTFTYHNNLPQGQAGMFPVSNNANGIMTFHNHTGEYYHQIGLSSNGALYHRGNRTGSWGKVYTEHQKPTAADVGAAPSGYGLGTNSTLPLGRGSANRLIPNGWTEYNKDAGDTDGAFSYGNILHSGHRNNATGNNGWLAQLFFATDGGLFHRVSTAGSYTGKAWNRVYTSANPPTAADVGAAGLTTENSYSGRNAYNIETRFTGGGSYTDPEYGVNRAIKVGADGIAVNGGAKISGGIVVDGQITSNNDIATSSGNVGVFSRGAITSIAKDGNNIQNQSVRLYSNLNMWIDGVDGSYIGANYGHSTAGWFKPDINKSSVFLQIGNTLESFCIRYSAAGSSDVGQNVYKIYHQGFKPTTLDIQSIDERTKEVSSLADVITEMRLEIESLKSEINQLRSKQ